MDFWDLTKLLFRRWYVAAPLLLASIAGTVAAAMTIEPDYVATSYVQLVPPAVTPKQNDGKAPQPRNPWLDLGTSSLGKASILTVQDQKVVELLKKSGFSDTFTLTLDSTLPIVTFEVIASTEEQAARTNEELIKRFNQSVTALQTDYGAAKDQSITTHRLDLGTNITESTSKVKRAIVAIGGVSVLLTVAVTVVLDAVLRRRTPGRAGAGRVGDDEGSRGSAPRGAGRSANARTSAGGQAPSPPIDLPEAEPPTERIPRRFPMGTDRDRPTESGLKPRPDQPDEATVVLPRAGLQAVRSKGQRR